MSSVSLVALSKPSAQTDCYSVDQLVAYIARVSNPANQNNNVTGPKLLKYLIKNQHWSPFEMVHLTMEINTTRDIGRQILRHRSFAFQEFSQRYAVADEFINNREARLQDTKNRQNSIESEDAGLKDWWTGKQADIVLQVQKIYEVALQYGIAKEVARAILPEGLTMTRMYMAGSLRSWIHYIMLRQANGTQKEHREIALQCKEVVLQHFPSLQGLLDTE